MLACVWAAALLAGCHTASPAAATAADAPAASTAERRDTALTETIRTGMKRASIPGVIVGVWRDGQPPCVRAYGVRDTASGALLGLAIEKVSGHITRIISPGNLWPGLPKE